MRRAWVTARTRLGHRGLFLLLLGTTETGYGSGLFAAAATPPARLHWWPASTGLGGFPLNMWGVIWCLTGVLCLAAAWTRADQIAYAAAVLLNAGWAAFAVQRWITSSEPGSWAPAVIYAGIAGGVFIVSGWPETPHIPEPPPSLPPPPAPSDLDNLIRLTEHPEQPP